MSFAPHFAKQRDLAFHGARRAIESIGDIPISEASPLQPRNLAQRSILQAVHPLFDFLIADHGKALSSRTGTPARRSMIVSDS